MTEYALTYEIAPEMLKRAMLSWARPMRSRTQKLRLAALGAVVFVALVAVLVVLLRYGIVNNSGLIGGLFGFYAGIGVWLLVHRYSTGKLVGFSNEALARQGPVDAVFNAQAVTMTSRISMGRMEWQCFDDVIAMPDATVLRAGAVVYAVPDHALPAGITPANFRSDLTRWLEAAK